MDVIIRTENQRNKDRNMHLSSKSFVNLKCNTQQYKNPIHQHDQHLGHLIGQQLEMELTISQNNQRSKYQSVCNKKNCKIF